MTELRAGGATDTGLVRDHNEDNYLTDEGLFAVADGVGGHKAGEVASQTAVDTLQREFREPTTDGLVDAVKTANRTVWDLAESTPYKRDRILLCSDGLTNEVSDDEIASTLRSVGDPEEAARQLVNEARDHGGSDNITCVVVDVLDDDNRAETASKALAAEPPPPPR